MCGYDDGSVLTRGCYQCVDMMMGQCLLGDDVWI